MFQLSGGEPADPSELGGKGANLVALKRAGFPVPDGFVVPVSSYRTFLDSASLRDKILRILGMTDLGDESDLSESSAKIKALIESSPLDPSLIEAIKSATSASGAPSLWAVRSSATAEDLPAASFAGQQDTYLKVRSDDVADTVKKCWASFWNERAIAYRHNTGISQIDGGIAVIVQRMVDAKSSGVIFTCDPVSGRDDEIVIESSWGLGESIVSGMVTPDRFVIQRKSLKIKDRKVSTKPKATYLSGGSAVEVSPDLQGSPSLSDKEIKALAEIGMRIEKLFNSPQDIEWSIEGGAIRILQSRAVTTVSRGGETLWTRAYGDEYWADVTSPLFFSWLGEWLSKYVLEEGYCVMGYWELRGLELLKLHKGHIYFNTAVLEAVFTFNPRFSRTKELLNYFPEKDQERIANAKTKILRRIWAEVRILFKDWDGMITRTDKAYRKWAAEFLEGMVRFDGLNLETLTDAELKSEYDSMVQKFLKHFRLIRYGMVTHSIGMNMMVKRWLQDWLGDTSGSLYANIVSALPDNKTITTNNALIVLARSVRDDPLVSALINGLPPKQFLEEVYYNPAIHSFCEKFTAFLKEYGHRSHTREMYFPRWSDDPTLVVEILRSLAAAPDIDIEKLEKEKLEKRLQTEKEILDRISKLRFGFFKKIIFRTVMRYAQTYLQFRENQRFYLDHIIYRQRRIFVEYGRRLAERGLLERPDDVFFLSKEEVFDMAAGKIGDMGEEIRRRRAEFVKYSDKLPPKFLRGKVEFDDSVQFRGDMTKVTGTSASPGTATGTVRVVESIGELAEVNSGEILVTSNTDPGWTPVFSKLGGLITETGGILSHGAVVSREYGIPAVTAVKDAKKIFRTGQRVTIDGNEGAIYILGDG